MAYRKATGRPLKVAVSVKTSRDLIRRHLHTRGLTIANSLAIWWNMHPTSAYRRMYDKRRPLTPNYIEAAIEGLQLDNIDATRLRLLAAREAGWLLDPMYLNLVLRADGQRA